MAKRRVTRTGKDKEGDITKLCGEWGSASTALAIKEIEDGTHSYYVQDALGRTADVHVVKDTTKGKYLRTDANSDCSDNLDNLPDC